jgi:hypothetical protein
MHNRVGTKVRADALDTSPESNRKYIFRSDRSNRFYQLEKYEREDLSKIQFRI